MKNRDPVVIKTTIREEPPREIPSIGKPKKSVAEWILEKLKIRRNK